MLQSPLRFILVGLLVATLSACGGQNGDGIFGAARDGGSSAQFDGDTVAGGSIFDLFRTANPEVSTKVNRYLWSASLEVLNFLPIQTVDPFTGVIVTGFGTPPGGGRAYRATVLIDDPALDARSLSVALQTRGGAAVSKATSRAVEDAILSRARELRIRDSRF